MLWDVYHIIFILECHNDLEYYLNMLMCLCFKRHVMICRCFLAKDYPIPSISSLLPTRRMARTRADQIRRAAAGAAAGRGRSTRRGEQKSERIIVIMSMLYIMMMIDSCCYHYHFNMTCALICYA